MVQRWQSHQAYNAEDRHAKSVNKNKVAYNFIVESVGNTKTINYHELYQEVNKTASSLKGTGITKCDRVVAYLLMIPELPIT